MKDFFKTYLYNSYTTAIQASSPHLVQRVSTPSPIPARPCSHDTPSQIPPIPIAPHRSRRLSPTDRVDSKTTPSSVRGCRMKNVCNHDLFAADVMNLEVTTCLFSPANTTVAQAMQKTTRERIGFSDRGREFTTMRVRHASA
jgi:hypothetical protein